MQEVLERLEFRCTNNHVEYEALIAALEHVVSMGVRNIEAFGDSNLVAQQVRGESQCLDGMLNQCCDSCTQLVDNLDTFYIKHVQREGSLVVNELAQQASGYDVKRGSSVQERGRRHEV
jgi:ribonuclease HI